MLQNADSNRSKEVREDIHETHERGRSRESLNQLPDTPPHPDPEPPSMKPITSHFNSQQMGADPQRMSPAHDELTDIQDYGAT